MIIIPLTLSLLVGGLACAVVFLVGIKIQNLLIQRRLAQILRERGRR